MAQIQDGLLQLLDEEECPKCGEKRRRLECYYCGREAEVINCGHYTQPQPISGGAKTGRPTCQPCAERHGEI